MSFDHFVEQKPHEYHVDWTTSIATNDTTNNNHNHNNKRIHQTPQNLK